MKYKSPTRVEITFDDNLPAMESQYYEAIAEDQPDRIFSAGTEVIHGLSARVGFLHTALQDHLEQLRKVVESLDERTL